MSRRVGELLSGCPFCGEQPTVYSRGGAWGSKCAQNGHYVQTYGKTEAEAIEAWNRRSSLSQEEGETPIAWRDVVAERQRQISFEGWTPEHDDTHEQGQLAYAGACYALTPLFARPVAWSDMFTRLWPWEEAWWKPTDRRRDLVKAAALILAEIERLDRATATEDSTNG